VRRAFDLARSISDDPASDTSADAWGIAAKSAAGSRRFAEALNDCARAEAIYRKRSFTTGLADVLALEARIALAAAQATRAAARANEALALYDRPNAADQSELQDILLTAAKVRLETGGVREARALLERALALATRRPQQRPSRAADIRFQLARALSLTNGDAELAHASATAALDFYRGQETLYADEIAAIEAWLKSHPIASPRLP
jgi:hypothetical protein